MIKRLKDLFGPKPMHDLEIDRLAIALNSPTVRTRWLEAVLDDLRRLNLSVDSLLESGDYRKLPLVAARRAQTLELLRQIEASETSVALDLKHNQGDELDLLAVQPAPGK